ncbi:hypothetical protein NECAME_03698 [Necator americanus]|uniref:Uncharacterized protein n=1 Tax=Necator americanus TaxID=51031 RepID=W2T3B8_NECAM|nr:hypothetical protein NECAME_03698 [Necator americanus]ETN75726.1 hypothetical protein NECAME_03698 [Necator americanus]
MDLHYGERAFCSARPSSPPDTSTTRIHTTLSRVDSQRSQENLLSSVVNSGGAPGRSSTTVATAAAAPGKTALRRGRTVTSSSSVSVGRAELLPSGQHVLRLPYTPGASKMDRKTRRPIIALPPAATRLPPRPVSGGTHMHPLAHHLRPDRVDLMNSLERLRNSVIIFFGACAFFGILVQ